MSTKFKGDVRVDGDLILNQEPTDRAAIIDANKEIKSSSVTTTELGYVSGVTSSIQDQLDALPADADVIKKDGSVAFTGDQSMGGFKLTDLDAPTLDDDAATKEYVDDSIAALPDPMVYKGLWNASTNTPTLTDGSGDNGDVYQVSVAGTQFTPSIDFEVGDKAVYNGATGKYEKWDMTDSVISVNGQNGIVVLDASDISYDNVASGLTATNVQDAIDEVQAEIDALPADYITSVSDTASVDLEVSAGELTATVLPAGVDHDQLLNYVANEHVDHSTVEIQTVSDSGLSGGGDITSTRSLSVDINGTTIAAAVDPVNDELLIYDNSEAALRKVKIEDIASPNVIETVADTNSIDLTITGTELTADVKLSATGADASNQPVSIIEETDGLRAQILDSSINNVAANRTLSNLSSPTSINQSLIPDVTITKDLGSSSKKFSVAYLDTTLTTDISVRDQNNLAIGAISARTTSTSPSGVSSTFSLSNNTSQTGANRRAIYVSTSNRTTTESSGTVNLETGNTFDGNSGDINLRTGTISGTGARGKVSILSNTIDVNSTKIVNLSDPTAAQDAATKAYVDASIPSSTTGDIALTSFAGANNVSSPADVTGFAFSNGVVRSFQALVSITVDATSDLFESYTLLGVQRGADWSLSQTSTGDDSVVNFTITSSGQIQYTSDNYAGFSSLEIQFRAIVTQI